MKQLGIFVLAALALGGCVPKEAGDPLKGKTAQTVGAPKMNVGADMKEAPTEAPPTGAAPTPGTQAPPGPATIAPEVAAKGGDCATHMQQLGQWLRASTTDIRDEFNKPKYKQMPPTETQQVTIVRAILSKKYGADATLCPITHKPYLLGLRAIAKLQAFGVAADTAPHPDGLRLVLTETQPGTPQAQMMVVPFAEAQQQFQVVKAESQKQMEIAKYRLPDKNTPEGKCLQIVKELTDAYIKFANEHQGKFPVGATSLDVRKDLQSLRPAATQDSAWICPITGKTYDIGPEIVRLGMQGMKTYKGPPFPVIYDSEPHPDGSRCAAVSNFPVPIRIKPEEWAKIKR